MKKEEISEAMGLIDEELIKEVDNTRVIRRRKKYFWKVGVAVAASISLLTMGVLTRDSQPVKAYVIKEAEYPTMLQYPEEKNFIDKKTGQMNYDAFHAQEEKWASASHDRLKQYDVNNEGLEQFLLSSTRQFLSDEKDNNLVYSPLNVYMALCMLAEVSDGNSRDEILKVLGVDSIDKVRSQASNLWNANYCDDGVTTSILANSIWLNEKVSFNKSTMNTLAENYYASSYQGEMGSENFNKIFQDWLNDQTGGLLKEQAKGVKLTPGTIMALTSTVYFKGKWNSVFNKNETKEGIFHATKGDLTCDFMHMSMQNDYYYGDGYSAIKKDFENGEAMWLILPDKGIAPYDLIQNGTTVNLPIKGGDSKHLVVNLSMPKFDVASDMKLKDGLKALGIKDVFDPNLSDFTPMTKDAENIFVSEANHAVRVQVDEEGCKAAAYTVLGLTGGAMPPEEEIDFVLDRPFIFVITSKSNTPLFTGIVNQPLE